jgi:hypothetical protein
VEMKLLKFIAEKEKSGTKTSMTIEAPWRKWTYLIRTESTQNWNNGRHHLNSLCSRIEQLSSSEGFWAVFLSNPVFVVRSCEWKMNDSKLNSYQDSYNSFLISRALSLDRTGRAVVSNWRSKDWNSKSNNPVRSRWSSS